MLQTALQTKEIHNKDTIELKDTYNHLRVLAGNGHWMSHLFVTYFNVGPVRAAAIETLTRHVVSFYACRVAPNQNVVFSDIVTCFPINLTLKHSLNKIFNVKRREAERSLDAINVREDFSPSALCRFPVYTFCSASRQMFRVCCNTLMSCFQIIIHWLHGQQKNLNTSKYV